MEQSKRRLLAQIYVKTRLGIDPTEDIDTNLLDTLYNEGLLTENYRLTEEARKKIKIGVIGGVFDIIHRGHIETLKEASKYVDTLVVIIATDKTVLKMKGHPPINTAKERRYVVESIKYVDYAIIGDEKDFRKPIYLIDPDIIFLGYDQNIPPGITREDLRNRLIIRLNVEVEGVKTSIIKEKLKRIYLDSVK